jgi:hypothetical protein
MTGVLARIAPARMAALTLAAVVLVCCGSCSRKSDDGSDRKVTSLGSVEVTAQLVEIRGEFPPNNLYDYVYILKYRLLQVHRGRIEGDTILVGHYNPLKPRAEAADAKAPGIGGNLRRFQAGDVHRMALDVPLDDHYMGPIINKYLGDTSSPLYWAVWTNRVVR